VSEESAAAGSVQPPSSTAGPDPALAPQPGLVSALWRYPDYRTLWSVTLLTQIAHWTFQIAVAWLMLRLTGSAFYIGLLGFFAGIPFLIVSIPAGVVIDRFDRRRILMISQAAALAAGLSIALLAGFGAARPWHLLVATFLSGAAVAFKNATQQTMVPGLVPREGLQNAIALMAAGQNTTRILGPGLAGPAIALIGVAGALYVQAVVLVVSLLNTAQLPRVDTSAVRALNLRRNLVDGIAYMARSRMLTSLMLMAIAPTLLAFPYLNFLPVYASDILDIGPTGLSLLFAAGGLGAVTGALLIAGGNRIQRRGRYIIVVTMAYSAVLITFAYSTWLPLSLVMLYLGGVCGSSFMSINNTLLHLNVGDEIRGRVMGVYLLTFGMMPLGALPMGYLADRIGMSHAVAIGALLMLSSVIVIAIRYPELRRL
jgi:MFS family permease